jgi:hypothetical protein
MTRRGYLTKTEWAAMLERQGGKCACGCGRTPDDGRFEADHSTPNTWEAGKPDQLLHWRCHRIKTKSDMREIARTNRLNGKSLSQYEKRKRFGPAMKSRNSFQDRRNG